MKHEFTDERFEEEVLQSPVPVLVDFWAPWCGPCRAMAPIVEELAGELDAAVIKIGAMNVDEHGNAAQTYGVMSIPTFIIFKNGAEVARMSGSMDKDVLKAKILEHAA